MITETQKPSCRQTASARLWAKESNGVLFLLRSSTVDGSAVFNWLPRALGRLKHRRRFPTEPPERTGKPKTVEAQAGKRRNRPPSAYASGGLRKNRLKRTLRLSNPFEEESRASDPTSWFGCTIVEIGCGTRPGRVRWRCGRDDDGRTLASSEVRCT